MRCRLTKHSGRGTVVQSVGEEDKTGALPIEGRLVRFIREVEAIHRYNDRAKREGLPLKKAPPDIPARVITEALRMNGHVVFVADHGHRMCSSTIRHIDWTVSPIEVETENSRYLIEVLRSTETPTDPRGRRR